MRAAVKAGWLLGVIAGLAVAGIVVSSFSLYHHYGTERTSYCDFGERFNCDIVNRSTYSEIEGIPVALIGILGYAVLLILATLHRKRPKMPLMLMSASLAGLCFALYLTYVEKFILGAWCVLCLSSLGVIAAIAALAALLFMLEARRA